MPEPWRCASKPSHPCLGTRDNKWWLTYGPSRVSCSGEWDESAGGKERGWERKAGGMNKASGQNLKRGWRIAEQSDHVIWGGRTGRGKKSRWALMWFGPDWIICRGVLFFFVSLVSWISPVGWLYCQMQPNLFFSFLLLYPNADKRKIWFSHVFCNRQVFPLIEREDLRDLLAPSFLSYIDGKEYL